MAGGPCDALSNFRKIVLTMMGVQMTIVVVCLTLCVNIMRDQSAVNQRLVEIGTIQKDLAQKVDDAKFDAARSLAVGLKAESDVAWIREGMTEIKLYMRENRYKRNERYNRENP